MSVNHDAYLQALVQEECTVTILQKHGISSFVHFVLHNFKNRTDIEMVVDIWRISPDLEEKYKPPPDELQDEMAPFVGYTLAFMLDNSNNANNPDQEYGPIAPPIEYYLNLDWNTRKACFYRSLEKKDILIGKVIQHDPANEEHIVQILCFAGAKNRYINDLKICMYIKHNVHNRLKIDDFIRGFWCGANIITKQLYLSLDQSNLGADVHLGVINESDFPSNYKAFLAKPLNAYASYVGLADKKIAYSARDTLRALNLSSDRVYTYRDSLRKSIAFVGIPPEQTISHIWKNRNKHLSAFWLQKAQDYWDEQDIRESLKAFNHGTRFDPDNIQGLLNRVAVYGNISKFSKALDDLEQCIVLDPSNKRTIQYFYDVLTAQAEGFEAKENYLGAIKCYIRLMKLPAYAENVKLNRKLLYAVAKYQDRKMFNYVWEDEPEDVSSRSSSSDNYDDLDDIDAPSTSELLARKEQILRAVAELGSASSEASEDVEITATKEKDKHKERCETFVELCRRKSKSPLKRRRKRSRHSSSHHKAVPKKHKKRRTRSREPHSSHHSRPHHERRSRSSSSEHPRRSRPTFSFDAPRRILEQYRKK